MFDTLSLFSACFDTQVNISYNVMSPIRNKLYNPDIFFTNLTKVFYLKIFKKLIKIWIQFHFNFPLRSLKKIYQKLTKKKLLFYLFFPIHI